MCSCRVVYLMQWEGCVDLFLQVIYLMQWEGCLDVFLQIALLDAM